MHANSRVLALLHCSLALFLIFSFVATLDGQQPKKIVLLAGEMDEGHPRGTHEYQKTVELLLRDLQPFEERLNYRVEVHYHGWPEDDTALDDADTILLVSDGCDRQLASHPFLVGNRLAKVEQQMSRGCGLVLLHWSTFWPEQHRDKILKWTGGYFDYETGPEPRLWFSKIDTFKSDCVVANPEHPVAKGVKRFPLEEEFYYNLRFADEEMGQVTPVIQTRALDEPELQTVAWAFERQAGGRGFGFTGGHFFRNWQEPNFRKMVENAILWTAGIEVPPRGVITKPQPMPEGRVDFLDDKKINTVIITGDNHPAHPWRSTTEVLVDTLRQDSRIAVDTGSIELLEDPRLQNYDSIVFNYCNWQKPGLSEKAKRNFTRFLNRGGGLVLVHFANGAFHFSLPDAGDSDWPEYREICRRAWDHGESGHDAYGRFAVQIKKAQHPIMSGIEPFETVDELYYKQAGDLPIEVLATAKSKVTRQSEPMSFVYNYGKGRVFQTVLGHSAESLRTPGTSQMIRNAVVWTAKRNVQASVSGGEALAAVADDNRALDARTGYLRVTAGHENGALKNREVSCRTQLFSKKNFNILVAQHPKPSQKHWELYTYAGSGELSLYLPGFSPAEIKSGVDVCDGQWHAVAAQFDGSQVLLFVDGKQVKQQQVEPIKVNNATSGPMTIGALASEQLGCDGFIDDVVIKGVAESTAASLGHWNFNAKSVTNVVDRSDLAQETTYIRTGLEKEYLDKWTPKSRQDSRFPYENETDADWIDSRFSQMDTGPIFCNSIRVPGRGVIPKAIARRDPEKKCHWLYNTETFRVEAVWSGDFLALPPARFGILKTPSVAGQILYLCDDNAGWRTKENGKSVEADFPLRGFVATQRGIHFRHQVDETVEVELVDEMPVIKHQFLTEGLAPETRFELNLGKQKGDWVYLPTGRAQLNDGTLSLDVGLARTGWQFVYHVSPDGEMGNDRLKTLQPCARPKAENRWGPPIKTRGVLGKSDGPFAVDAITIPYQNRYNALMFVSGFDFLPNGRAVVCTAHGDVWLVDGIDEDLDELLWKRIATGLYQPLGLKVVAWDAYVMCRDRIIRFDFLGYQHLDGMREVTFHHAFNEDLVVTGQNHAYAMSLETDPDGNFYFIKSGGTPPHGGTMLKVDSAGKSMEVYATGYRHANGMGISPGGVITSADNEGNWIPSTRIDVVRQGGFYGHMPTHRRQIKPEIYDPPLIWLPREMDNSAGGQVWVDSDSWGPLNGSMIHLSYGRCTANVVLPQQLDDDTWQAAAYRLDTTPFLSGSMRGRFNPRDGHLYVCGLDGWQTAAVRDGCFQRIRATGKKFYQPTGFQVNSNTIEIEFPQQLDPQSVQKSAWKVEQWNYRYSEQYGSDHYQVSNPQQVGHDRLQVTEVELSADSRTVALTFAQLKPVMQMNIQAEIKAADGTPISLDLYNTINRLK